MSTDSVYSLCLRRSFSSLDISTSWSSIGNVSRGLSTGRTSVPTAIYHNIVHKYIKMYYQHLPGAFSDPVSVANLAFLASEPPINDPHDRHRDQSCKNVILL